MAEKHIHQRTGDWILGMNTKPGHIGPGIEIQNARVNSLVHFTSFDPKCIFDLHNLVPIPEEGGNTLLPLSFLILCSNYGLSGFALYLQPALVFLRFFPAKIEKKQTRKHPAGLNAEPELRIVNTRPCNLQNAFVIFTSNFSFSTDGAPRTERRRQRNAWKRKLKHKETSSCIFVIWDNCLDVEMRSCSPSRWVPASLHKCTSTHTNRTVSVRLRKFFGWRLN